MVVTGIPGFAQGIDLVSREHRSAQIWRSTRQLIDDLPERNHTSVHP